MLSVDHTKGFMYQVGDIEYLLVLEENACTVNHTECFQIRAKESLGHCGNVLDRCCVMNGTL